MVIRLKKSVFLIIIFLLAVFVVCVFDVSEISEASAEQSVGIPVIMYHQISRKGDNVGKYVIAQAELEKDLIYLKENGYVTVNTEDIISFTEGKGKLPEKCVMLTFDDGYETGYTILYPLLKKYNMKAVLSVVGSLTELYTENEDHNDRYSYLNEEEIRILSLSDEVEIQNHSYNMHFCEKGKRKGINRLNGESFDEYKTEICNDVGKMQEYLLSVTGKLPTALAYPFGEYCADTAEICKSLGIKVTFTCEEKVSVLTKYQRESLYNIGRFNRSGQADRTEFFKKVFGP